MQEPLDVTAAALCRGVRVRAQPLSCGMRTLRVYLLLLLLLAFSLGAGFFAADWPTWCVRAHWCAPGWPHIVAP